MPETKTVDERLLHQLAEIAGQKFSEDDITYEGTRLVIPKTMTAEKAIKTLRSHIEQQQTETRFTKTYRFRPWDGAAAFDRAIKKLTGTSGIGKAQWSFFTGKVPPTFQTVPVGVNESMQVPWGQIQVDLIEGVVTLTSISDDEYGPLFHISVDCPRKYRAAVEGLFRLVQQELNEYSIYRGKAFDGQDMPEFIDLSGVDREKVVYSDEVEAQLEANVWSLLRYTNQMVDAGMPLKRAVLLHGPYGTGKTLAAFLTAQEAISRGWTFLYCRPGRDNLHNVMATARLYQPSVVFFEDVDAISEGESDDRDSVTQLLDLFDGIQSKGTQIMAVLTTNHPEKIHKGMVRPGRLDSVIEIGNLDANGIERLIRSIVPEEKLDSVLDKEAIAGAMEDYLPAFVKEAIDRAVRYSIVANDGEVKPLTTQDFVLAGHGLRPQFEMMNDAEEGRPKDRLTETLTSIVRDELDRSELHQSGDYLAEVRVKS